MGLKDDFLEALNSVKKDIFNGSGDAENKTDDETVEAAAPENEHYYDYDNQYAAQTEASGYEIASPEASDSAVFDAFRQASAIDDAGYAESDGGYAEDDGRLHSGEPGQPIPTFRSYDPNYVGGDVSGPPAVNSFGSSNGKMYDFDRTDLYSDDKTIISKNTVIRGAIQTDDSVRLLGQVHGDIDCKSNIVVAGKVRGNTSAANAYIMDAQVDGSLMCDDIVSVSSDAWVLGDIKAQQAEIDGKIKGNLDIRHAVSIGSTSSIIGNISTDELEIKRGAFINGQIMMYTPSRDVLDRFDHFEK